MVCLSSKLINFMKNNSIFLLLWGTIFAGCVYDPPSGFITVHNYSDSAVYVYETFMDSLPCGNPLKLFQTLGGKSINSRGNALKDTLSPSYRVNAYAFGEIGVLGNPSEPKLPKNNKKIILFFIKESTMRTKTWEEICRYQLYERKLVYTEAELDLMDWLVTYIP